MKYLIIPLESFYHIDDEFRSGYRTPAFLLQTGRGPGNLRREILPPHIDAYAHDHIVDEVPLRAHLRQHPADLFPVHHDIIGPFDPGPQAAGLFYPLRHGQSHHQRHHGSQLHPKIRLQNQRKIHIGPRRAAPGPAPASPPCSLHVRHDQSTLFRPVLRIQLGLEVRGAQLIIEVHRLSGPYGIHAAHQLVLPIDLLPGRQPVSPVLHRLYPVAFLFQLPNGFPYRCPRHPEAFAQLLSGDIILPLPQKRQYLCFHLFLPVPILFVTPIRHN